MAVAQRSFAPMGMEGRVRLDWNPAQYSRELYERVGRRVTRVAIKLRGLVIAERIDGLRRRRFTDPERAEYQRVVSYVAERRKQIHDQIEYLEREKKESEWEAREIQRILERNLSNQGFDYFFSRDGDRHRQVTRVEFIQISPDEYRYKIDGESLPHGVNMLDMTDESVVKTVMAAIGLQVEAHLDEGGLWFRCYRNSGIRNIPRYCTWEQCNAMLPDNHGPLVIALGLKSNRKLATIDLDDDTKAHGLVAGSTGGGKTTILHGIICSLMQRNPADVKLILVDLKRMEFKRYSYIPHLARPVVLDIVKVLPLIREIYTECERRMKLLESDRGYNHINAYNKTHPENRLPRLITVFDEIATIMLDPTLPAKTKNEFESYAAQIAQKGRALGVHLILATQRPEHSVIRPLIRACFNLRIATACSSIEDSKLIIQNGDACFRDAVPPGRCVMNSGRYNITLQAAFISQQAIDDLITAAESGQLHKRKMAHDVHLQDLIEWALREWTQLPKTHPYGSVGTVARWETKQHFTLRSVPHADVDWMLEDGKRGFIYKEREYRLDEYERSDAPGIRAGNKPLWIIDIQLEREQRLAAETIAAVEPEPIVRELSDSEKRELAAKSLSEFVLQFCELDQAVWTSSSDLMTAYSDWAGSNGHSSTATDKQWGKILRKNNCLPENEWIDGRTVRGWRGIRPLRLTACTIDAQYSIVASVCDQGATADIPDPIRTKEE